MTKEQIAMMLFWMHKNCEPRTTSRNNVYAAYWYVKDTGQFYTHAELIEHWLKYIYAEPVKAE